VTSPDSRTPQMSDLIEFLDARYAEDWDDAQGDHELRCNIHDPDLDLPDARQEWLTHCTCPVRKRLLGIEAKRRINDEYKQAHRAWEATYEQERSRYPHPALADIQAANKAGDLMDAWAGAVRILSRPYEDHAGYWPGWHAGRPA
jgi:hypothetical protein